ncbi:MAG: biopolymer transporter ExbD [Planctomycetota bacterium]|nr:biopolymer transporter ExbD [Planctomycetota bacterium]MDA1179336.1 biopolymer transporter ExbD [Planctomycetota bacterium]
MPVRLRKTDSIASISMTPLIDVVFLLLVFFLVATRFDAEERRMDVMLPSAAEAQPMISQRRELVINIDQAGTVFLGSHSILGGSLMELLQKAVGNRPLEQSVVIRADRRCNWESVVRVMDACHAVGVRDIYPVTTGES